MSSIELECDVCEDYIWMDIVMTEFDTDILGIMTRSRIVCCPKCGTKYVYKDYFKAMDGEDMERLE